MEDFLRGAEVVILMIILGILGVYFWVGLIWVAVHLTWLFILFLILLLVSMIGLAVRDPDA